MNDCCFYEKIMFDNYLPKLKLLRDQWQYEQNQEDFSLYSAIGDECPHYLFLVNESRRIISDMFKEIVYCLMKEYCHSFELIPIKWESCKFYVHPENNAKALPYPIGVSGNNLAFIVNENKSRKLFVFKDFGINERIPNQLISLVQQKYNFNDYAYISFVEDDAYKEQINHNDDLTDPSRGTKVYSLKHFFLRMFSAEEYKCFSTTLAEFSKRAREYYAVKVVRNLSSSSLVAYKETVRNKICSFNYHSKIDLDESLLSKIDQQFLHMKYYTSILSDNDFAISFLTAEWMFTSLLEAKHIDLTTIALGYLKASEQLLYSIACLYTYEKEKARDHKTRTIMFKKQPTDLTDSFMSNEREAITIGDLKSFFSYYKNRDLIRSELLTNDNVFNQVIIALTNIKELRNGYLHKDNLYNYKIVEEIRDSFYCLIYLMMGAYQIDEDAKKSLGIKEEETKDTEKLCSYIHNRVGGSQEGIVPVFYINGATDDEAALLATPDIRLTKINDEIPIHTGIYLKHIGKKEDFDTYYPIDSLPNMVTEGRLILHLDNMKHLLLKLTGPEKTIFKDGKFLCAE